MKRRYISIWMVLVGLLAALVMLPGAAVEAEFGVNWSATFFNTPNLTGTPSPVAGINGINFNWGTGVPVVNGVAVPGIPADNFSARFTSVQTFAAGNYDFVVSSDDGVRVLIDGAIVWDQFIGRPLTTDTFTRTMTAGSHTLTVEYFDSIEGAVIQFQWFAQGTSVTPTYLFTPTPIYTAVPPLTVQVVNVRGLSLRTGPYLGASMVGVVRPGTTYAPLARNRDEGTYTWYKITDGDRTGWVSGRYLQVTGDPNAVGVEVTIFEQIDGAGNTGVTGSPRSVMNLRRRPSQRSNRLAQIPWGGDVEILGRTIQAGKNFWLQVRYENQVGWIYAPYVSIYGDINLVPVR